MLGSLVVSELVLDECAKKLSSKEIKHAVLAFCKLKLQPFETPALLKTVEIIKTNETGKKVRNL